MQPKNITPQCQSPLPNGRIRLPQSPSLIDLRPSQSSTVSTLRMGLHDLKKRWSSSPSKGVHKDSVSPSDAEAPSPIIPMDSKRLMHARGEKQRPMPEYSIYPNPNRANHVHLESPTRSSKANDNVVPTSPSFTTTTDRNSASREPLFHHDFPTSPIPNEFKPYSNAAAHDFAVPERKHHTQQQKRTVRMDLDAQDYEDARLQRSKAQTPHVVEPQRTRLVKARPRAPSGDRVLKDSSTPNSHRARRNSFPPPSMPSPQREAPPVPSDNLRPDSTVSSSPSTTRYPGSQHTNSSVLSLETKASSVESNSLPALQTKSVLPEGEHLEPVMEDDPASFDLVLPTDGEARVFQLEDRNDLMFSREHLKEIFKDTNLLLQFTNFLSAKRPRSVPLLVYYLDALKALRAIKYANAVAEALSPLQDYNFSEQLAKPTMNEMLEMRAKDAFDALVKDDLPAFITHTFVRVVSLSISRRITGTLPPHLREASEGLAEVFCLTDPSRQDNPIVFASEEFHRTTQYGVSYAIGRNCRFLQGPRTNKYSIERLGQAIRQEREVSEVFLNYRRDGSPFMNMLMCAPLLDSRGKCRYVIGAQVDVSGLCKEGTDLPGLQRLIAKQEAAKEAEKRAANGQHITDPEPEEEEEHKDTFQELAEMFNETELNMVRKHGGKMHREQIDEESDRRGDRPRLLIKEPSDPSTSPRQTAASLAVRNGKLEGIYQNYLLVRPYPSLRILFCSPSLRVPGILQSPFLDRIGGSSRVRETLVAALADGRGVTAKVRWLSSRNSTEEGRPRWIHCTPLLGNNGAIGVWMVVLVDDDKGEGHRKYRQPPPVEPTLRAKKSEVEMFDPPGLPPQALRRRTSQDAVYRHYVNGRPDTRGSGGGESLESFTIEPA